LPNYLNQVIKSKSGFTASYHIKQRIILEAKRKATHLQSGLKEIAYKIMMLLFLRIRRQ